MKIISKTIAALFYGLLSTVALAQPVVTPPPFTAQNPTLGTLPTYNDTSANWKNAGLAVIGGIPNRTTQCGATVPATNLNPPVANDDAVKLNAAIAACTAGQVVQFGCGTFNYALSELPILVNKGITLRGCSTSTTTCNAATGTPCWGTVLQTYDGPQPKYNTTPQCGITITTTTACGNQSGLLYFSPQGLFNDGWAGCAWTIVNPTASNCGATIAADVAQGATQVQVSSTTNFSVGTWALVDEYPAMVTVTDPSGGPNFLASPEFLNTTGSPNVMRLANPDLGNDMATCVAGGNPGYGFCVNRLNSEIRKITAISSSCPGTGCTLTFDGPLTMAYRQSGSHDARVYWPTLQSANVATPFVEQASIENLTITRVAGGAINFNYCAYCWVKNVEVNYWIGGAVNFIHSARDHVTGSYLHNCIDCQNNGQEYPIGISTASTEILIDNNIITFGGKGMVGRAANTAVVAYNYMDKTFYETGAGIGDYWNDMGVNGSHYGGTHHFLFEGNWATNCDGDNTHGNAIYHTFFRNQCNGGRTTFVDPSSSQTVNDCAGIGFADPGNTPNAPAPLRAFGPMAWNYWYAFVGNVAGFSGMQSCAGGAFVYGANATNANRSIWISGWTGAGSDVNLTGVSNRFLFKHGNYDYVNASIVDYTSGFSRALPNSYYTSARPSYFGPGATCTYPWPWIDSASGTPVKSNSCGGSGLPAKARFDAGTPFVQP
jgi:hypothetical protein